MELMSVVFIMAVVEACFLWFVVVALFGYVLVFFNRNTFSNLRTLEGERGI